MQKRFSLFAAVLPFLALGCGASGSDSKSPSSDKGGASNTGGGGTSSSGASGTGGSSFGGSGALPSTGIPRSPPGSCGLDAPAFCEEFAEKHPGGNGGDLDETLFHFARWGHETRQHFVRIPASTESNTLYPSTFCGQPFSNVLMPDDIQICDGIGVDGLVSTQLNEVYDDQGDFAINSNRIRQLFDFTDRTGTIVFDVDAKINPCNLGHGWWVEFWVTEEPGPIPYHEAPGVLSYPRKGFGLNLQGLRTCPQGQEATEIAGMLVTNDYSIVHAYPGWELDHDSDTGRCIKIADGRMNRFKILLNKDTAEVWASDFDDPMNLHRMATINNLDLTFTRGYVHLQHSQYNGRKDGCTNGDITGVQTYRWDNIGFDGPTYTNPRAYEVPYNSVPDIDGAGGYMYGYTLTAGNWVSMPLKGVDLSGALGASLDYSFLGHQGNGFALLYRFNGGPTHTFEIPAFLDSGGGPRNGTRAFSNDIPLGELMSGDNTVEFSLNQPPPEGQQYVANIELTVNH